MEKDQVVVQAVIPRGEVRVYYDIEDAFNSLDEAMEFERDLDDVLQKHGLSRWASGEDLQTHIRDIAYELCT